VGFSTSMREMPWGRASLVSKDLPPQVRPEVASDDLWQVSCRSSIRALTETYGMYNLLMAA
jgi:hypothetical protein